MGMKWNSNNFVVLAVLGLILRIAGVCHGGITSSYVRNDDLARDMPLDSDVFQVPPGFNAPQQVCKGLPFSCTFL